MSKVIDGKIEEEILDGLNYNKITGQPMYSYKLPKFFQNDSGEYIFVGNAMISSLTEFKQYLRAYGDIAKQLTSYRRVVGQVYKNALNSLIADNTKYQTGNHSYSFSTKLSNTSFTANNVRESKYENYGETLSYLTKAAFKTRRLKPSAEINNLMNNESTNIQGILSVLPVMTDNGIVLNQSKTNNALVEANFKTISSKGANEIKNYMYSATNELPEETAVQFRTEIDKLFKEARQIGELVESGVNENIAERLEKLAVEFSDLIGIDLTHYEKTPAVKKDVAEPHSSQKKELEVNEIYIDGSYKTAPALEDGKMVTKLTPDGLKFTVKLKNKKLNLKTVEEDSDLDFDMLFK